MWNRKIVYSEPLNILASQNENLFFLGDKPEIKTAAARPYIKITVTDEDKQEEEGKKDGSADVKENVPTTEL